MPSEAVSDVLELGRQAYAQRTWTDARELLSQADGSAPLAGDDLERLATAAYMLGRDAEWLGALERAYHGHVDAGETFRAVRCAFWMGMHLAMRGEVGRATGWLGRAQRLVEREPGEHAERGYLLLPLAFQREAAGDFAGAASLAGEAVEFGERFRDPDLFALAAHAQGQFLISDGRVAEGLALLDEAMLAVTEQQPSPVATGIVYCGVILACQAVFDVRRAQEWTAALSRWCEAQVGLVAFTGRCLVHRAEIMQLHGEWLGALEEARRAAPRLAQTGSPAAIAEAFYRQGEVHRLQGRFSAAEEAYREASLHGFEPQPGLALLRLAQGNGEAAAAAIRRVVDAETSPRRRAGLLPAYVEIMLAAADLESARRACGELEEIAAARPGGMLSAIAAHAHAATELAAGDVRAALVSARGAAQAWQELGAPYEAARARVLVAIACRTVGDGDAAALELEAARSTFEELGAAPDVARVGALAGRPAQGADHGLTERELEVLRLVAWGRSNREIAAALVISEHTVARHLQNIFRKVGVSSRTAAGAFAFERGLADRGQK